MAQALKEPACLVSRYLSASPRRRATLSNKGPLKRQNTTGSSQVLAALEALDLNKVAEDADSDIEIIGPFPVIGKNTRRNDEIKRKPRSEVQKNTELKPEQIHPFFYNPSFHMKFPDSATFEKGSNAVPKDHNKFTTCETSTTTKPPTTAAPSRSTSTPETQAIASGDFPKYSHKDYTNPKAHLVYTKHEEEANDLVVGLKHGPVALDLEWRVFFTRRSDSVSAQVIERRTAVVQVADSSGLILVIQVYGMEKFPRNLQSLIENPSISKLGVNILNDGKKLFKDYGILAKNLVELGAVALMVDPEGAKEKRKIVSLAKLVERYCRKTLEKGKVRIGNWEADLSQTQLEYAADDAHSSVMIYQKLQEIAEERGVSIEESSSTYTSNVVVPSAPPSSRTPSQGPEVVGSEGRVRGLRTATKASSEPMRPQYLRAYKYWHERGMSIEKMCTELSLKALGVDGKTREALKASTVISYIIGALRADNSLPFDVIKLKDLVQLDSGSWARHNNWILPVLEKHRAELEREDIN